MVSLTNAPLTVRVPATSANLGPGFDVLGMALQVYNTVTVEVLGPSTKGTQPPTPRITLQGEGAAALAVTSENLTYRSLCALFDRAGEAVPDVSLHCVNRIPVGRGLGSSAAAIVGGVVAANFLLGQTFSREELLACALTLEPHPDNLAAALYGGVTIAVCRDDDLPIVRAFSPAPGLAVVLLVPERASSTAYARTILPREVTRADAVFNMARTALLVHALARGETDLLNTAMEDRLHQPQRGVLFPALPALIDIARANGAYGAALSGAGSTVLALSAPERASAVSAAMLSVAERLELHARGIITEVALDGASVTAAISTHDAENLA